MEKELKSKLLEQLGAKELPAVLAELIKAIPEEHPARGRVGQLDKRFRELESRIAQGTLSSEDINRVKARISGGLREIILDYRPGTAKTIVPEVKKEVFTLDLGQGDEPEPVADKVAIVGFQGEVVYDGSPSKKEVSLMLNKGYGAAYHTAVQGIRKCGMEMIKGDRAGGTIAATAPGNTVARFGEVIFLWLTPQKSGQTLVRVVVDSANPKTVFDLGRNQQKMQALLHQLRNG